VKIGPSNVHRILVDNGSAVNILTYEVYSKMGYLDKDLLPTENTLYCFSGISVRTKGSIKLPVTMGESPNVATQIAEFMVVDQQSTYNAIIGRPILKDMKIVTSIYHLCMKFPTPKGVGCVKGIQYEARECYSKALRNAENYSKSGDYQSRFEPSDSNPAARKRRTSSPTNSMECNMIHEVEGTPSEARPDGTSHDCSSPMADELEVRPLESAGTGIEDFDLDPRFPMKHERPEAAEEVLKIKVDEGDPSKVLQIGSNLSNQLKEQMMEFLKANLDVFAWWGSIQK